MSGIRWDDKVAFDEAKPGKAALWLGDRLFAGLNCLRPGQAQPPHIHAGAEKFYLVLEGRGSFEVGGERFTADAGTLVPAPAGVPHGVANDGPEPLVLLSVMAPPPERT